MYLMPVTSALAYTNICYEIYSFVGRSQVAAVTSVCQTGLFGSPRKISLPFHSLVLWGETVLLSLSLLTQGGVVGDGPY